MTKNETTLTLRAAAKYAAGGKLQTEDAPGIRVTLAYLYTVEATCLLIGVGLGGLLAKVFL